MTWFLVIGGVGVLLLLVSLVGGDVLDGVDFGGDLFSGAALAGFLGAFGFAGALAAGATSNTGVGIVVGLVAGVVVGGLVGYATARLRRGGDEATVRSAQLPGQHGTVISAIPEGGLGEVSIVVAGHITKLNARAATALPSGTPVTVSAVLSATSVMVQPRPEPFTQEHTRMDPLSLPPTLIAVVGIIVLVVLLAGLVTTRYKVAGPNEAFIVTGRKGKEVRNTETGQVSTDMSGQKVVMGGGVFVLPFVQRLHVLDLSSRRISVQIRGAVSGQGVKLNLDGVAIVKVGGNEDSIRAAAQRFLTQQAEIETFTQETLAGSLRSIVGSLSVEQIIRDRAAFAQRVADESETSLTGQGLVLDTFQIQDITDDGSYLADLGRPEAAKVGQLAAVAEAAARQAAEQARIVAEQEIAVSQRMLALKTSEIKAETDAAQAQAAAAGPLAQADRDQAILTEQEKVAVRQAALKERQLDTEVRKPADAERYRVETEAEGRRNSQIFDADARKAASIAAAEADAEKARLTGEGEKSRRSALAEAEAIEGARRGEAEKARRIAEAEATRAEGDAQAAAILATGEAEAEAMNKRAEAFARYNDAAVLQMLVEVLPQVAREVAAPMASIDRLTVISTDGAGQLPRQVTENIVQTMELLKNTTGVDLESLLSGYLTRGRGGESNGTPPAAVEDRAAQDVPVKD